MNLARRRITIQSTIRLLEGHRGYGKHRPYNSLQAINTALKNPRLSSIELDVRMTKDGVLCVTHGVEEDDDVKADQTSNLPVIENLYWNEVKDLPVGTFSEKKQSSGQECIPSLEHVFKHLQENGSTLGLNLDLKTNAPSESDIGAEISKFLQNHSHPEELRLSSFHEKQLVEVQKRTAKFPVGKVLDVEDLRLNTLESSDLKFRAGMDWLHLPAEGDDPQGLFVRDLIKRCHKKDIKTMVWFPVNDGESGEQLETWPYLMELQGLGVHRLCVNDLFHSENQLD